MIKRYLARRNNPWELLVVAVMIFVPGLVMLLHQGPMIGFVARTSRTSRRQFLEILSPEAAHIFGAVAITFSVLIICSYFWARRAIARDCEPRVVEHGHSKII